MARYGEDRVTTLGFAIRLSDVPELATSGIDAGRVDDVKVQIQSEVSFEETRQQLKPFRASRQF